MPVRGYFSGSNLAPVSYTHLLLPATLAGNGPDVSMDADPVGYGIRNAVIPLNYFENENDYMGENVMGYSEVVNLFNEEAFVPLTVLDPVSYTHLDRSCRSQRSGKINVFKNDIRTYNAFLR